MVGPCRSRCGTSKNPHCLMAKSAEHRSKFAALHRQWWRLNKWKILEWHQKLQTNKTVLIFFHPKNPIYLNPHYISPELKAQVRFTDRLSFVSVTSRPSVRLYTFSYHFHPLFQKHSVYLNQTYSNEGQSIFPTGDNNGNAIIFWRNFKIFFSRTTGHVQKN